MYGFFNFTFVELALSDIYFVAQDAKQEHKICYETTPHYYLLAFSKFCYKHASLEKGAGQEKAEESHHILSGM
jgi:hypothetical protein